MKYVCSYNGVRRYGEDRVSVSKKWTELDPPVGREVYEEDLWQMSDEDYDKFLAERKEMRKRA